jgi:hypothetical protein
MHDPLHPSDLRDPTPREAELDQYVDSFRVSSTRSRVALYVVIVATVLIAVTNYNLQSWSWPRQRIRTWFKYSVWDAQRQPDKGVLMPPDIHAAPTIPQEIVGGDARLLQIAREEYWRQFIARTAFTSSPIPGVSIDANDLGIIGGGALTLMMMVLLVCLMREHENLYLALYKVRQYTRLENCSHGTSEANLLYHALVMSQVLASPPTLARWRYRGVLRHFGAIYALPLSVYFWLLYTNSTTFPVAVTYVGREAALRYMKIQWIIAGCLGILTVLSWLNSRAMAQRWITAFKAVNPLRNRLPQMSFLEWLRVPGRRLFSRLVGPAVDHLCAARTSTEIVDTFRAAPERDNLFMAENITAELDDVGYVIKGWQLRELTRRVCAEGMRKAKDQIGDRKPQLLSFLVSSNHVEDGTWKITGTWRFRAKGKEATQTWYAKLWERVAL